MRPPAPNTPTRMATRGTLHTGATVTAMYPGTYAATAPDRPAVIMGGSREVVTYARAERAVDPTGARAARRGAAARRPRRLVHGEPGRASSRSRGPRCAPGSTSRRSTATSPSPRSRYIVNDCEAKALVTSDGEGRGRAALTGRARHPGMSRVRLMVGGAVDGLSTLRGRARRAPPADPLGDETMGAAMLYSSGTTGRPKGVKRPLPDAARRATPIRPCCGGAVVFGWGEDTVYLSPAPMYHAAPLAFSLERAALRRHRRRHGAVRRGRSARAHRARAGHAHAVGADDVRPHAEAARRGAPRARPVVAPGRDPRGGAVPGRGEAADDRVVGSDPPRVLRRHRGQRRHVHHERGLARSTRARSAASRSAAPHRRRGRQRPPAEHRGHDLLRRRRRSSSTTTTRRRPKAHA